MNQDFYKAMEFIFQAEGGLSVDKNDPGGTTKYGISQRANPDIDIENLSKDQAKEIYYRRYWLPSSANIQPYPVCIVHMDCAVNCGIHRAMQLLNDSFGETPQDQAINYIGLRANFYTELVKKNPKLAVYLRGWLNRLNNLTKFISL